LRGSLHRFMSDKDEQDLEKALVKDDAADPAYLTEDRARIAIILKPLLNYLRRAQSEAFVKQKLSSAFALDVAATSTLLTRIIRSPAHAPNTSPIRMAIDDLVDPEFVERPLPRPSALESSPVFQSLLLVHKAALIL